MIRTCTIALGFEWRNGTAMAHVMSFQSNAMMETSECIHWSVSNQQNYVME